MCQMCMKYQTYYLDGPELLFLQLERSNYQKMVEHFLHLSRFDLISRQNN